MYVRRALEILRKEGIGKLCKVSKRKLENVVDLCRRKVNQIRLVRYYSLGSIPNIVREYSVPVSRIKWIIYHDQLKEKFGGRIPEGPIWRGNWDRLKSDFEESQVYQSFVQRFEKGDSWNQTSYYRHLTEEGELSHEEAMLRLQKYEELFDEIRRHGYDNKYPIEVNIGRDGEYIRHNGRHRLSIAKILNMEEVPVKVHAIHEKWQKIRDDVYNNEVSKKRRKHIQGHPDLQDVV